MHIQLIPVEQFQDFLICTSRVAGFFSAIPIFSSGQAPARVKAGLVVTLSLIMFPIMGPQMPKMEFVPFTLGILLVSEILLGMLLGLIARFIFTAVQLGGTVVGYQMGFAAANVFDPQSETQLALISQFQNVFAILIFLALDGHHIFLRVAVNSYELLPPGQLNLGGEAIPYLFTLSSRMFSLGVQFSAPVLVVLLLSGLTLGVLSKVFPQLNAFMLSFPLNIGISFAVIALTLDMVVLLLSREFDDLGNRFLTIMQYLQ